MFDLDDVDIEAMKRRAKMWDDMSPYVQRQYLRDQLEDIQGYVYQIQSTQKEILRKLNNQLVIQHKLGYEYGMKEGFKTGHARGILDLQEEDK